MTPNSEANHTRDQGQASGARRSRRFTVRMDLSVRASPAWRTLKRPEGRAPFASLPGLIFLAALAVIFAPRAAPSQTRDLVGGNLIQFSDNGAWTWYSDE